MDKQLKVVDTRIQLRWFGAVESGGYKQQILG